MEMHPLLPPHTDTFPHGVSDGGEDRRKQLDEQQEALADNGNATAEERTTRERPKQTLRGVVQKRALWSWGWGPSRAPVPLLPRCSVDVRTGGRTQLQRSGEKRWPHPGAKP